MNVSKKWSSDPNNRTKLVFLDSYLLLPEELAKLSLTFKGSLKGSMNFNLVNKCNNLLNIKEELLIYNRQDCLVLYEIIAKFENFIYEKFQVNIHKCPTISSLSFAIFISNYLDKNSKIPITDTNLYEKLISGYTGGHVDVYNIVSPPNKKVYCYDVNSLYPFVMANFPFPVGNPNYFEGHLDIEKAFGFLKVKVHAPLDLKIPLLFPSL